MILSALIALGLLTVSISASGVSKTMCWRQGIGRGVGVPPAQCPGGQQMQGALCYPDCKQGYTGDLFVCWQDCPSDFPDQGAYCGKPSAYGRGAGYPWIPSDGDSFKGAFERCQKANPGNPCVLYGAIVYPKCKTDYHNDGCCICSANCPAGMPDIGVSCQKNSYVRATNSPVCASNQVLSAGLCYPPCSSQYEGNGPVCWSLCTERYPIECGMACAMSHKNCTVGIIEQIEYVAEVLKKLGIKLPIEPSNIVDDMINNHSPLEFIEHLAKLKKMPLPKSTVNKAISLLKDNPYQLPICNLPSLQTFVNVL